MTSYRQPDYDIDLYLSCSNFQAIAGVAFGATVSFCETTQGYSGILIVPKGNSFSEKVPVANAWLWLKDRNNALAETRVTVTLGESCDPMLTQEEQYALMDQKGLALEGVIIRNWNT